MAENNHVVGPRERVVGPRERVVRTAIQVVIAVVAAVPAAVAAFEATGVEVPTRPVALAIGAGGAFVVLVSAAQNAWDSRTPR